MRNKQALIVLLIIGLFLIGFGYGVGSAFGADTKDPMYWFPLIFSALFTYNIFAYFFGWTIFGGPGGTIGSDSDAFNRIGGAILSGVFLAIFMFWWFSDYL